MGKVRGGKAGKSKVAYGKASAGVRRPLKKTRVGIQIPYNVANARAKYLQINTF